MAPSVRRFLALLGMIGLTLVAAVVVLVASYGGDGWDGAAVVFFVATLVALAGLAAGSRLVTGVGILGHFGSAVYVLLPVDGPGSWRFLFFLAVGVIAVDFLATSAILMPWMPADVPAALPAPPAPAEIWQRNTAIVLLALVALVSSGLLLWAAAHDGVGWAFGPGVGLGGAVVCIAALLAGRGSIAVGFGAAQGMLMVLLFLLFGWATREGLLHVLTLSADVLTIWAGYLLQPERRP